MSKKENIVTYVIAVSIMSGMFGKTIYTKYTEGGFTLWEVTYCSLIIFILINISAILGHRMMNNPNTR